MRERERENVRKPCIQFTVGGERVEGEIANKDKETLV